MYVYFARSIVPGYHSIPKISQGSFRARCEEKWGSFRGRYHFGVDLGIISMRGTLVPQQGTRYILTVSTKGQKILACLSRAVNVFPKAA